MVHCNPTFRARQIVNIYDATQTKGVAQKFNADQVGADEISDSVQDTSLALQSANMSNTGVCKLWTKPITPLHNKRQC
jgi:hypothetical protein